MKNIRVFLSENFIFLVVKFSVYLNRHVFVMISKGFNIGGWGGWCNAIQLRSLNG